MNDTDLTYDDLNVMLETLHDSDSEKDYNPLYRIVNRPQSTEWHSSGYAFEKKVENFSNTNYIEDENTKYIEDNNKFIILIFIFLFINIIFCANF